MDAYPQAIRAFVCLKNNPYPVIKSLSGSHTSTIFAGPFLHMGLAVDTHQGKANIFIKQYRPFNHLFCNKEAIVCMRQQKATLNLPMIEMNSCTSWRARQ